MENIIAINQKIWDYLICKIKIKWNRCINKTKTLHNFGTLIDRIMVGPLTTLENKDILNPLTECVIGAHREWNDLYRPLHNHPLHKWYHNLVGFFFDTPKGDFWHRHYRMDFFVLKISGWIFGQHNYDRNFWHQNVGFLWDEFWTGWLAAWSSNQKVSNTFRYMGGVTVDSYRCKTVKWINVLTFRYITLALGYAKIPLNHWLFILNNLFPSL